MRRYVLGMVLSLCAVAAFSPPNAKRQLHFINVGQGARLSANLDKGPIALFGKTLHNGCPK